MLSNVRGEPFYTPGGGVQPHQTPRAEHRLPPVGNFAPTPTVNKDNKRKRGDRQGTVQSQIGMMPESSVGAKAAPFGQMAPVNKVSECPSFYTGSRMASLPRDLPSNSAQLPPPFKFSEARSNHSPHVCLLSWATQRTRWIFMASSIPVSRHLLSVSTMLTSFTYSARSKHMARDSQVDLTNHLFHQH